MLNQNDEHSSFNPANQVETDLPTWDSIMDRLTAEENEVIYNEIYDIKAPMRKLKAIQKQIDAIQKEQEELNPFTSGLTKEEVDAKWSKLYTKRANLEARLRDIIIKS